MLSQKKRRRKRKKSLLPIPIASSTQPSQSPIVPSSTVKPIPKLNKNYVMEEAEVKSALRKRNEKRNTFEAEHQEANIQFFTEHIVCPKVENSHKIELSEHTPSSSKTNELDGLQLASSYIQIENDSLLRKWQKEKHIYNDDELIFHPRRDKIQSIAEDHLVKNSWRNLQTEGLHAPQKPRVSAPNKILLINRVLEEGSAVAWMDPEEPQNLVGLEKCVQHILYRTKCAKEFYPQRFIAQNIENHTLITDLKVINLHIYEVIFDHHPAYNEEYNLARSIETLFEQYKIRRKENAAGHLKNRVASIRHLVVDLENDSKIQQLKKDLTDVRKQMHREQIMDREIVRSLLKQWKNLKDIRTQHGFQSTLHKLIIRAEETDQELDQQKWNTEFTEEVNEIYNENIEIYNEDRQKQRIGKSKNTDNTDEDFEPIQKLVRPDFDDIREKLNKIYLESRRHPGEPIIYFELENVAGSGHTLSPNKLSFLFEIVFDNEKVSASENIPFGNVKVDYAISIQLTRKIPDTIKLMIYEKKHLNPKDKIAEVIIPVPVEYDTFTDSPKTYLNFSSKTSNISGKISVKIGWDKVQKNGKNDRSKKSYSQPNKQVQKWYDDHLLDPMDPDIKSLVDPLTKTQTSYDETGAKSKNKFRTNEDLTAFCTAAELNGNRRLNMLIARFNNDLQFKNQVVPQIEREIPDYTEEDMKILEELGWMDPIDVQRHRGRKYFRNIYRVMINHFEAMTESIYSQDLLIGDTPPTMNSVMQMCAQIFGPKRPLNPRRMSTTTIRKTLKPAHVNNLKIIVNVFRATGIPMRSKQDDVVARSSTNGSIIPQRINSVTPFVTVSFKDKTVRSTIAEGSNPTWNEQIILPVNGNVIRGNMKEYLSIQIFDEIVTDLLEHDRPRESEIYQRVGSNWIGELRIPFATIYKTQRLEGTFEMTSPNILLGYTRTPITSSSSTFIENILETRNMIHLTVFITLEPKIEIPKFYTDQLECTELIEIKNRIQMWFVEFKDEFPGRCRNPLINLSNGKRICITRLIGSIPIPFHKTDVSEFLIRRFVSLIPIQQTSDFCASLEGVWFTNDQIINGLCASTKDLGVLLTCYYQFLGYQAFLIIGQTLLCGDSTFVLIKENVAYFLIDPVTGRKYSCKDTLCPLIRVYCLINGENVWANIQKEDRVFLTRFDVGQTSEWRPLFGKSCKAPVGLVHNMQLEYRDSDDVTELKRVIEQKLMKKISSWRTSLRTTWNRNISETLRQILVQHEEDTCFELQKKDNLEKLTSIMTTYKIIGFPLNMPYINLSSIVERVKSTGIHLNMDQRVEYSIAIHIQQYPSNVLSLWVFPISLVPQIIGLK